MSKYFKTDEDSDSRAKLPVTANSTRKEVTARMTDFETEMGQQDSSKGRRWPHKPTNWVQSSETL